MADILSNVKLGPEKFVDLAVKHIVTQMFPIKNKVDKNVFDLHSLSLDESSLLTLINKDVIDDSSFGVAYILFGTYQSKLSNGFIVVLLPSTLEIKPSTLDNQPSAVEPTVEIRFVSSSTMQLIEVRKESKSFKSKLNRRIRSNASSTLIKVSDYLSFNALSATILIVRSETKQSDFQNICLWNSGISDIGFIQAFETNKFLKRKRTTLISEGTANSLLEVSDLKPSSSSSSSGKKLKNLCKGATTIYADVQATKSNNNSMTNLREEAISFVDDAFSEHISPEDFVNGYLALKSKCDDRSSLGAISANILMDASFRITDCGSFANDSIITKAGIDIDQVSTSHNIPVRINSSLIDYIFSLILLS